jgi:hypothetical protein
MNRRFSARHGFALILALILCAIPTLASAQGDTPSVTVTDQESDGTTVTVGEVVATVPGWMVIHLDNNGSPGPVVGQTAVEAGSNSDVVVTLDPALEGDTSLWAMLHVDEGAVGTYEFPGPDVPVRDGDMIVMTPFVATVSAMEADVATTEAMTDTAEMADSEAMTETEEMAETEAMTETAEMAETEAMTETEEMAESADMGETEAMTDTAEMADTTYMTETEEMGEMEAMTETMEMAETEAMTETEEMAEEAAPAEEMAEGAAPEVLPVTGAGLGGVAQALPAALAALGALAGAAWLSRRRTR